MKLVGQWVIVAAVLLQSGCLKLLDAYYTAPKHFSPGTAKLRQMDKNVEQAYKAALRTMELEEWGVSKKELKPDSAMIRAHKNSRELVIDIKGEGDSSSVRAEIDQAGNDGELWNIMNHMDMMP